MKLLLLSLICAFGAMARLTNRAPADMVEDEADGIAIRAILRNIHPPGSLPGVVVSSQSRTSPVSLYSKAGTCVQH